jgi:hypothetical protein
MNDTKALFIHCALWIRKDLYEVNVNAVFLRTVAEDTDVLAFRFWPDPMAPRSECRPSLFGTDAG